jgi:hypothetical protein
MKRAQEIDLLTDYFADRLGESEKDWVIERRNSDPEFEKEFEMMKTFHLLGERRKNMAIIREIASEQEQKDELPIPLFKRVGQWIGSNPMKAAAAIALLVLLGFLAIRDSSAFDQKTIVQNDSANVELPERNTPVKDGSNLAINPIDSGQNKISPNPKKDPIEWLKAQGFSVPEKISGRMWRGVVKMAEIEGVQVRNAQDPDKVDAADKIRIVAFQNPNLPTVEYHFDKELFLFMAKDPSSIPWGEVQLFSHKSGGEPKYFLKMEGRLYEVVRGGKNESTEILEEEKRKEYLEIFEDY